MPTSKQSLSTKAAFAPISSWVMSGLAQGRLKMAGNHYQKAVSLGSQAPWVRFKLGRTEQRKGNTDKAISYYQQAISLNPNNPQFHYYLGLAKADQSDIKQASASYEQTLALNPDHTKALEALQSIKT